MAENLMQVASDLKMLPDDQLQRLMQSQGSPAPQFLVLSELQEREKTRAAAAAQQQQQPTTVAQDIMRSAQPQGNPMMTRGSMPGQMAPQGYADGGPVGGLGGAADSIEVNHGLGGSLADLNRNPAAAAAAAQSAGVSADQKFFDDMSKKIQGNGGFAAGLNRIGVMQSDPEGYKRFLGMAEKKQSGGGRFGSIKLNDGGPVGGLMPLSRDPATGKVRFGG
jgi:hypothetical protein